MPNSLGDFLRDLPEAVLPPLLTAEPNARKVIHDGEMMLTLGGTLYVVNGTLIQEWLPDPRVRFSGSIETSELLSLSITEGLLEVPNRLTGAPVLLTRVERSLGRKSRASGILNGEAHWSTPDSGELPAITFALTNFHTYLGSPIRRNGGASRARLAFSSGDWSVTIDEVENWRNLKKTLEGTGGFAVSHGGRLEKAAGPIRIVDLQQMRSVLTFYLALLRGQWCGPVWPCSPSDNYILLASMLLSKHKNVLSWFPVHEVPDLSHSFSAFLALWNDGDWNEPLRHAIWWYVEANRAATSESSIVMTQTALELLGWVVLVEHEEALSADGFDRLSAADKLRLLLGRFDIPPSLDVLPSLRKFCRGYNIKDGPEAFTLIRNAIVHPSVRKRAQLAQAGTDAKWEARQLGLKYLELTLLALIDYAGSYRDRTDMQRTSGQPVPWA